MFKISSEVMDLHNMEVPKEALFLLLLGWGLTKIVLLTIKYFWVITLAKLLKLLENKLFAKLLPT